MAKRVVIEISHHAWACVIGISQPFQLMLWLAIALSRDMSETWIRWILCVELIHGRSIKTWKPGWNDSTWVNRFNDRAMNLKWIFIMTPSRAKVVLDREVSPYFFFMDWAGEGWGQIQCRSIISRDFRRFSRTRFTRWIFCIFNRRRPLCICRLLILFQSPTSLFDTHTHTQKGKLM